VFNFTNLQPRGGNVFSLSTADQAGVFEALRAAHPAGPAAVLGKTESLCVHFDRRAGRENAGADAASWRNQMAARPDRVPYRHLASLPLGHGWEAWAGLSPARDKRAPSLYPLEQLVENSLWLDPETRRQPQGTLWVEIWAQESEHPDKIPRLDRKPQPLGEYLADWDAAIRRQLRRLAP
jgi:hypothetical protein